jgi:hypothetical protein
MGGERDYNYSHNSNSGEFKFGFEIAACSGAAKHERDTAAPPECRAAAGGRAGDSCALSLCFFTGVFFPKLAVPTTQNFTGATTWD